MIHRRLAALAAVLTAALLAGCGSTHHAKTVKIPGRVVNACPQAIQGHGAMGGCEPPRVLAPAARAKASSTTGGGITYPDLSNNDPCVCAATLLAHGHPAEVLKTNQGVGFLDGTFYRMAADAKAHGLAVGGYDFDSEYTTGEAYALVGQLHRAGIWRNTPNTLPPTLDVEYGASSRAGVERQLAVLFHEYGRADIYTGGWYWLPHFGCWWPKGVPAWLSGYPVATVFCGLPPSLFVVHQYTDRGYNGASFSDMNVWRGSAASFRVFARQAPAAETASQKRTRLYSYYRARAGERHLIAVRHAVLEHHECKTRRPISRGCAEVKRLGNASHLQLTRLEREIRALHAQHVY